MIILTAANTDIAKTDSGGVYKNFSFRSVIQKTVKQAEEYGYKPIVYDLGSLGIGKPFHIKDETFATKGYYEKEAQKGYKSKSLFKPEMVKSCMEEYNDFIVYLDGDAQLCANIDGIVEDDYDIGVTLRDPLEFESEWYKEYFEIVKYVNAGVIFFQPTLAAKRFIDIWHKRTKEVGNDQKALNQLTCPDYYPKVNSILTINGVRIKYFPGKLYNYYYFQYGLEAKTKIMHFKGSVRHFYPFDWKKRLYCMTVIPAINIIRPLARKLSLR
ncbi:MAG: putative nucleotide-diphospho-sugar transferase [Candidatus Hodarchaeota archaeon]